MEYKLRLSIGFDEEHWSLENFNEQRCLYYDKLANLLGINFKALDCAIIEFTNGNPELVNRIKSVIQKEYYDYDIWSFPSYTKEEIKTARYVALGTRYEPVGYDEDGISYNIYKKILCQKCRSYDMDMVPSPYRLGQDILHPKRDISRESNGVVILSETAFDLLREDIEQWVIWGDVEIVGGDTTDNKQKYVWIRPTSMVGSFVNSKIIQKCEKCDRPTEIRQRRSKDIFEFYKWTVDSFKNVKAPIVMAGNWFGEVHSGASMFSRYVFISGKLHEKIRKLKLKGFVKADRVIHAADEPYEWDPLKDYKSPDLKHKELMNKI